MFNVDTNKRRTEGVNIGDNLYLISLSNAYFISFFQQQYGENVK